MHKLNRTIAPTCLSHYRHGRNNWNDVTYANKQQIWIELNRFQGKRCAYCEDTLTSKCHIEHFEQRSRNPRLTFTWNNLFGSCDKSYSCGKHKDKQTYNVHDIIKPDIDDPEDYLRFLSDGRIIPKPDLNETAKNKAEETLRVFNLSHDTGPLRSIRQRNITGYIQTAEELAELVQEFGADKVGPLIDEEIGKIQSLPFATAIKHVLTEFIYE